MPSTDEIHKELDLLQDVIKRMADNSFKVKAWMMAIIGGVIALSKELLFIPSDGQINETATYGISIFLLLMIFSFWYLDGFFLRTEKLYREIYKWVIENRRKTSYYLYDLNTFSRTLDGKTKNLFEEVDSIPKVMFSKTLIPFYIVPLIFVIGLFIFNICK